MGSWKSQDHDHGITDWQRSWSWDHKESQKYGDHGHGIMKDHERQNCLLLYYIKNKS